MLKHVLRSLQPPLPELHPDGPAAFWADRILDTVIVGCFAYSLGLLLGLQVTGGLAFISWAIGTGITWTALIAWVLWHRRQSIYERAAARFDAAADRMAKGHLIR